jgi:hypothetical protein
MSETKFTPGPWKIGAYESGRMAVDGANGEEVTGYIDIEDAHLIAAAPDLYWILHQIATDIEAQGVLIEWHQAALDALAKARGEP